MAAAAPPPRKNDASDDALMAAIMKVDARTREIHLQSQEQFAELRSWLRDVSIARCFQCGEPFDDGNASVPVFESNEERPAPQVPRRSSAWDGANLAEHERTLVEKHPIIDVCKNHELFKGFPSEQLQRLVAKMVPFKLNAGEALFCAGDEGTNMFILQSGSVTCLTQENVEVKVLKAGECFGELTALGLSSERALTARARNESVVYRLAASDFQESFADRPGDYSKLQSAMKASALQKYLQEDCLRLTGSEKSDRTKFVGQHVLGQIGVDRRVDLVQFSVGGTGRHIHPNSAPAGSKPRYILHPLHVFAGAWDILIAAILLLTFIIMPFNFFDEFADSLSTVNILIDCFFMVDCHSPGHVIWPSCSLLLWCRQTA